MPPKGRKKSGKAGKDEVDEAREVEAQRSEAQEAGAEGLTPEATSPGATGTEGVGAEDTGQVAAVPVTGTATDLPAPVGGPAGAPASGGEERRDDGRPGPDNEYARVEPTLDAVAALGLGVGPRSNRPGQSLRELRPALPPAAVPVYGPVDRSTPPDVFAQDIPVRQRDTGQLLFVVRRPYSDPAGPLPGDSGRIRPYTDAGRTAVCYSLPPAARRDCLGRGGYF